MRDTFYGDLKYGNRTLEEIMSKTCEPPNLGGSEEYAYASAYAAWICNKYGTTIPAWCHDECSFSFADFVLCSYVTDNDIAAALSNPVKEFAARGWYIRERDLEIV